MFHLFIVCSSHEIKVLEKSCLLVMKKKVKECCGYLPANTFSQVHSSVKNTAMAVMNPAMASTA